MNWEDVLTHSTLLKTKYMKIYLYWLMKNDFPYYVGVTTRKRSRYNNEKKSDMVLVEEYDNRIDARNGEEYWIHQLRGWGFKIENKSLEPVKIAYRNSDFTELRTRILHRQKQDLDKAEAMTGIDQSLIVCKCIDELFKMFDSAKSKRIDWSKWP